MYALTDIRTHTDISPHTDIRSHIYTHIQIYAHTNTHTHNPYKHQVSDICEKAPTRNLMLIEIVLE